MNERENTIYNISLGRKLIDIFLFITFFLLIVTPNAFRTIKLIFIAISFLLSLSSILKLQREQLLILLLGSLITIIYIVVGLNKTTLPNEAFIQSITVFLLFPFFWIVISNYLLNNYSGNFILKKYVLLGSFGSISVFLALWAYNAGYKEFVSFLIENPNATFIEGVSVLTLNVYGSLIFITAGLGFVNKMYKPLTFMILIIIYIVAAIISGRSALILAAICGCVFFLVNNYRKTFSIFIWLIPSIFILLYILSYFGIDITNTFEFFFLKLTTGGGGAERSEQFKYLLDGIANNGLLGSGHGVGVKYIRNYEFPWRYELLPISVLYRVGMIGMFIYAYPYFTTIHRYVCLAKKKKLTSVDNFFFWGNTVFIITCFTNPYMESFEFQIPYFFTYTYFIYRIKNNLRESTHSYKIRC